MRVHDVGFPGTAGGLSTPDKVSGRSSAAIQLAVSYRPPKEVNFLPGDDAMACSHTRKIRDEDHLPSSEASDKIVRKRILVTDAYARRILARKD